jgi:hypothetical protein
MEAQNKQFQTGNSQGSSTPVVDNASLDVRHFSLWRVVVYKREMSRGVRRDAQYVGS